MERFPATRRGRCLCGQLSGADGKTLIQYFAPPYVVKIVCTGWLGLLGGVLALLGVVAAPISSGDTAFRSARLIVADRLKMKQIKLLHRLAISLPIFVAGLLLLLWQINNPDGFNVLWQYFGWSNQTLSIFTLWAITVALAKAHKNYVVTLIPALLMTAVCAVFLLVSPQALALSTGVIPWASLAVVAIALAWFFVWRRRQ